MREALTLRYDGGDIPTFLSRADKVYNQAKVGENVRFEHYEMHGNLTRCFSSLCCSEDPKTIKA